MFLFEKLIDLKISVTFGTPVVGHRCKHPRSGVSTGADTVNQCIEIETKDACDICTN